MPGEDDSVSDPRERARLLLAANDANIARKLGAGGTLSAAQIRKLQDQAAGVPETETSGTETEPNITALAKRLQITAKTMHVNLLKKKGNPGRNANGSYDVAEWQAFAIKTLNPRYARKIGAIVGGPQNFPASGRLTEEVDERGALSLKKLRSEAELAVFQLEKAKDAYILKSTAKDDVTKCNAKLRSELLRRFTQELPEEYRIVKGDPEKCRKINERVIGELLTFLHSGTW